MNPTPPNSVNRPAEVVLEHVAVKGGQVLGHDHVVLQLHLEGLHSGLEVGEDAGLGGQGHGGAGVPGTGGDLCTEHTLQHLIASLPDTRLVTSSGKLSITLDSSKYLYFRAFTVIGSSTLSYYSKGCDSRFNKQFFVMPIQYLEEVGEGRLADRLLGGVQGAGLEVELVWLSWCGRVVCRANRICDF